MAVALSDWDIEATSSESRRWGLCFAAILALHAAGLWLVLGLSPEIEPLPAGPPPVAVIELVPLPVAAPVVAPSPPPEPVTPPQPVEEAAPPSPAPIIEAPLPPRPKPVRRPPPPHVPPPIRAAPAPPQTPPLPTPPAPLPAVSAPRPSNAVPSWQSEVLARLERFKRYPALAQFRHQQGVVSLRFTIDRQGHVLSAQIAKGSGYDALDDEALALIHRAEPLPPPPSEMPGATLALTVPVQFFLK